MKLPCVKMWQKLMHSRWYVKSKSSSTEPCAFGRRLYNCSMGLTLLQRCQLIHTMCNRHLLHASVTVIFILSMYHVCIRGGIRIISNVQQAPVTCKCNGKIAHCTWRNIIHIHVNQQTCIHTCGFSACSAPDGAFAFIGAAEAPHNKEFSMRETRCSNE